MAEALAQIEDADQTQDDSGEDRPLAARDDPASVRIQLSLACKKSHKRFAEAFVRHGSDKVARGKAIIEAGYKNATNPEDAAVKILRRPEVMAYITALQREHAKSDLMNPEWVFSRLYDEATFFGKGCSPAARIRALEVIGDYKGMSKKEAAVQVAVPMKVFINVNPDDV